MKTLIYTALSHTGVWLAPQLRSLRAHLAGELEIVVVQGPCHAGDRPGLGTARISAETATSLGVSLLEAPPHLSAVPPLSRQAAIWRLMFADLPNRDSDFALMLHGDILLMRGTTFEELLDGRLSAARANGNRPWNTWIALDRRVKQDWLWDDLTAESRLWPAKLVREGDLTDVDGVVPFPHRMEVCEPCWLHTNAMSLEPPEVLAGKAVAARRLVGEWEDVPCLPADKPEPNWG